MRIATHLALHQPCTATPHCCPPHPPPYARSELAAHHHRDTNSTLLGLSDMLLYASAAEGVTTARMRFTLLERMAAPVGAPPAQSPAALLAKRVLQQKAQASGGGAAMEQ